jgi:hypothetical protein
LQANAPALTQQSRQIERNAANSDACCFFNLLTGAQLFDQAESVFPAHRERGGTQARGGWNEGVQHAYTGAFRRARARLPLDMVCTLARYTGQWISARAPRRWCWRAVRLVDGTTLTLPDSAANQARFAQSLSKKRGLGFPICRLEGMVCWAAGISRRGCGCVSRKGADGRTLPRSMPDTLERGDVLLGDAYFATYFLFCELASRGVDAVLKQNDACQFTIDFRRGLRLGACDHLNVLQKPIVKPHWMNQNNYEHAPHSVTVRELRVAGKTLVTTLLDAKHTTNSEIKRL